MTTYTETLENARRRGADDGRAAASWYFDGNTPRETYARVLQGIEDGDPKVLDTFPAPDLSGQWADMTSGPDLVPDDVPAEDGDFWLTEACDAYEEAFNQAVHDEIERVARHQTEE